MKKSQKRQKRLVLVAMVLMIGLVAGMGAMTYSKYITTATAPAQNATAAKWGFVVGINADDLFSADYSDGDHDELATKVDPNGVAVHAANVVVAPGTTGSMTCSIKGSAEVRAQITVTFNATSEIHYKTYYPIKWKIGDGAWMTLTELQAALNALTTVYEPGASAINIDYIISWKWDLVTAETGLNGSNRNVEDTIIGLKAHDSLVTAETITKAVGYTITADDISAANLSATMSFTFSINAEQIQA